MKYLRIQNKGVLPLKLLMLIGASTKTNDLSKIGEFGTGLKYAIAYFIRNQIQIKLFIGQHEVPITIRKNTIKESEYCEIVINKKPTGITTQYGFQWKAWEAIREIWCNALDEKNPIKEVWDFEQSHIEGGTKGHTTFYIECTDEIQKVLDNWSQHFLQDETPLFEDENYAIYPNSGKFLKLYKNGVLTHTSEYHKSIFRYDVKKSHLNELREYKGFMHGDVATALLNSNKKVTEILLDYFKSREEKKHEVDGTFGLFELTLDYGYASNVKSEKLKEIFQGYLFLHPDSHRKAISDKAAKVHKSLFEIVRSNFLPTEEIQYSSGGYYGGGGGYSGYSTVDLAYKPITNPQLKNRIDHLLEKYDKSSIKYEIAVPIKEVFDFLIKDKGAKVYVMNTDLEKLNDKDLEVVIILLLIDYNEDSIYKVSKRLIKAALANKNLKKIIFEQ